MAIVPQNTRFIGIAPDVDLTEKKSNKSNSYQEAYTMADIALSVDTASAAENVVFVNSVDDFPAAVSGVITLEEEVTYWITKPVDLLGARLVGAPNNVLVGGSSENSTLTSTGLGAGVPLYSSAYSTPIRHIAFVDVDTAIYFDGDSSLALDWYGVNFVNVPNVGEIGTIGNFIFVAGALLNSTNLKVTGTLGTFGIDGSIFTGTGAASPIIDITSTANITRRFRTIYSSFVVFGSTTGIYVDPSASIPVESYILDTVNFSAGGTYIDGVSYTDNKAFFINTKGVINTTATSNYYMRSNATATTITSTGVDYKISGTTTSSTITQRFTNTDNKAEYAGAFDRIFEVTFVASFTGGNNTIYELCVYKNGVEVSESCVSATSDGGGRAESVNGHAIVTLTPGDYIEIYVSNETNTQDITVTDLQVMLLPLN